MALFEALMVEAEAFGEVVAAAQAGHVVAEGAQELEVLTLIRLAGQLACGQGIAGGQEGGEMVVDAALASLSEFAGFGEEMGRLSEGGLLEEPGGVVAFFPFGEVAFVNGTAAK